MKLNQLFESNQNNDRIESLKKKLSSIEAQIKDLASNGTSVSQGAVAPQYKSQYDRLVAAKNDLLQRIKIEQERSPVKKEVPPVKQFNSEEKKQRHNTAKSEGRNQSHMLRNKHGGWEGLAKHVQTIVDPMTSGMTRKLHTDQIEQLASKFDVSTRTIYKWFERTEFSSLKRLLPNHW